MNQNRNRNKGLLKRALTTSSLNAGKGLKVGGLSNKSTTQTVNSVGYRENQSEEDRWVYLILNKETCWFYMDAPN